MAQEHFWEDCHPEIQDDRVDEVERELGVKFPQDYRESIKRCHGGRPKRNAFTFVDPQIGRMGSCLGVLLSFDKIDPENIVVTHEDLAPFLPSGVMPFADDGGGDFICFKYEQTKPTPSVVYWHHGERQVVPLAETFTAFLEMLHERPPRTVDVSNA